MICKNCQKEMPDVGEFCPFCGAAKEIEAPEVMEMTEEVSVEETVEEVVYEEPAEESAEEPVEESAEESAEAPVEAPAVIQKAKPKAWVWVLIAVGGILLVGALVLAILFGMGIVFNNVKDSQNETVAVDELPAEGLLSRNAYSAEDEVSKAAKDAVVATMGGKELTNGELQLYYQNLIYSFYSQYYYYMSYIGLDMSAPLDQQPCTMDEGKTWEQYFLEGALANWQSYTLLEIMAEEADFQVDQELQTELDHIGDDLKSYATAAGYESVEDYLAEGVGVNVDAEDYIHFNQVYYIANEYLNTFYEKDYPTQAEIDAYYAENEATFVENGVTKDLGLQSSVRHILVAVEGGTEGEDGVVTYSEEDWNTALAEAERILQEWKDGEATEDSFAALVGTYTDDIASVPTGGLYENVNADASYVEEFLNWSIDATRVPGDTGIVQTEFGYHIMYFVKGEDYCSFLVGDEIVADRVQKVLLAAKDQYPITVNYEDICLAQASVI